MVQPYYHMGPLPEPPHLLSQSCALHVAHTWSLECCVDLGFPPQHLPNQESSVLHLPHCPSTLPWNPFPVGKTMITSHICTKEDCHHLIAAQSWPHPHQHCSIARPLLAACLAPLCIHNCANCSPVLPEPLLASQWSGQEGIWSQCSALWIDKDWL